MKYLTKSKWKKAGLILLLILGLLQLIPQPKKNISLAITNNKIEQIYPMEDSILTILKTSCFDCHSNNTNYPWYSYVQPFAWFLNKHIVNGKAELNFDEFGSYSRRRQLSKLKSIASQVKDGDMPLTSYTLLHGESKLSEVEKVLILNWTFKTANILSVRN